MFTRDYLLSLECRIPILHRIQSKIRVDSNGCHNFTGVKDRCGYGRIRIGKHSLGAHKVMYVISVGDFDQDNLELLHTCDNPACVNTDHLTPGTHKENMHDCINKGRHTHQRGVPATVSAYRAKCSEHVNKSDDVIKLFSSRVIAISDGMPRYVGSLCKKHGIGIRKTKNGECIYCSREYESARAIRRRLLGKVTKHNVINPLSRAGAEIPG